MTGSTTADLVLTAAVFAGVIYAVREGASLLRAWLLERDKREDVAVQVAKIQADAARDVANIAAAAAIAVAECGVKSARVDRGLDDPAAAAPIVRTPEEELVAEFMRLEGKTLDDADRLALEWAVGRVASGKDPEQGSLGRAKALLARYGMPEPAPETTTDGVPSGV